MALYDVQVLDWNRTRDYFVAHLASLYYSAHTPQGQTPPGPDEFLLQQYPQRTRKTPLSTHDPDHGALGDWKTLKQALKGTTDDAKVRRSKLKPTRPHAPKP